MHNNTESSLPQNLRRGIHGHQDRDAIKERAAADFEALFVDLGGKFKNKKPFCPFHDNTETPSASISRRIFKCFACGVSLDAIGFTALMLRTDFRGALRYLGSRYGVAINAAKLAPGDAARYAREKQRRDRDLPIAELWRRAAVKMADESLVQMKADLFDPLAYVDPVDIQELERKRARLQRLRGAELVEEYRWMLEHHPTFTAALVRAAWNRQEAERRALQAYWNRREVSA